MPIDLVCGQCQGRLLAEEPGTVVACPHCGTHLHVPGDPAGNGAMTITPTENFSATPSAAVEPVVVGELVTSNLETADDAPPAAAIPAEPTAILSVDQALMVVEEAAAASPPVAAPPESPGLVPLSELPSHSTPRMPLDEPVTPPVPPLPAAPPMLVPAVTSPAPVAPMAATAPATQTPPVIVDTGPVRVAMVPRFWFYLVASYASAVTLAFVFLLLTLGRLKTHPLENLPDVVPKIQKSGEVALQVAPPEANVPPGHVLKLGESQRYGSLKVTPLRVTQGPLRFEHLLNDPTAARTTSEPVLKLWLRFENVSRNQEFMPLDSVLLFKRHYADFGNRVLTNQFLCKADQRRKGGELHHVYELSATSEFRIAGQNLETVVGPGRSIETFIPSEERIDDLTGELVWRVQFRKGYHPRTFHGVTTLIDVPFSRSDVKNDT